MTYDKTLIDEVRKFLSDLKVVEKRMFGGVAFMVNGKMCISVNNRQDHIMMVRIDPKKQAEAIKRKGAKLAIMRGKEMPGWIFLTKEAIKTETEFSYWINEALEYNKIISTQQKK